MTHLLRCSKRGVKMQMRINWRCAHTYVSAVLWTVGYQEKKTQEFFILGFQQSIPGFRGHCLAVVGRAVKCRERFRKVQACQRSSEDGHQSNCFQRWTKKVQILLFSIASLLSAETSDGRETDFHMEWTDVKKTHQALPYLIAGGVSSRGPSGDSQLRGRWERRHSRFL